MNFYISKVRILLIRLFSKNIKLKKGVFIDWQTRLRVKSGLLLIEENVYLRSDNKGYHASMAFPTTIFIETDDAICRIGKNSRINGAFLHAKKSIIIGKNTLIAAGTNIIDSNGHITKSLNRTSGSDIPKGIVIGDNVWIGLNSIILKGTEIGDNSIVSAGSVVKGKFPINSFIAGNPAVLINKLF